MLVSALIFIAAAPFAKVRLARVAAFMPIYESVLVVTDLITAVLLFGQFSFLRARALLVLASGYLFTALITVAHALTFPGLFAPTGLLGAGPRARPGCTCSGMAVSPCSSSCTRGSRTSGARRVSLAAPPGSRPGLILLDLHLPDVPGDEVLARLRLHPETREIPVVILSADATPGRIERLLAQGARAYLTKPFEIAELLALFDTTLSD